MISIIIVNWNGEKWLEKCLTSIMKQKINRKYEIILVDNGSTDNSLRLVHERFPNVKTVSLPRNLGFAAANNIGYMHAKGDLLVFVNMDTSARQGWLKNLVQAMDENPEYKILCSIQLPSGKAKTLGTFFEVKQVEEAEETENSTILESTFASGACFLTSRRWLSEVGYLFDPSYFCFSEDIDLSLRTVLMGGKIGYVKNSKIWHKGGGSNYARFWATRTDTVNALRTFQKLFTEKTCRRILLARLFYIVLRLLMRPRQIKINVAMLTGYIEFLAYRKDFCKKDREPMIQKIVDEKVLLKRLRYRKHVGRFVRKVVYRIAI
jgi:hypothetical protein